jgi:BirA family biotin operon repressor/biotin-[acetyl-CoA-carboxylase] ligase
MKQLTFPVIEPFDAENIRELVQSHNKVNLSRLDIFDSIASTNQYLLEQAKSEKVSGWFCFAESQTKGRGRPGKKWFSPRGGNIYCSVLWRFPLVLTGLAGLSLAVGVIVVEVLHKYGVKTGAGLKWPNDIIFAQRKLGGILIESMPPEKNSVAVVIGIGINLQLPQEAEKNWIALTEIIGAPIDRNRFAGLLVNELLAQLTHFQAHGLSGFLARWHELDILRDKPVTVSSAVENVNGIVQGISDTGELLLKTKAGGLQHFQCGEVNVRY